MKLYVNKQTKHSDYMATAHNVPNREQGEIIAAAREVSATVGIYITKKRYAILVYDNEGHREDKDDKPGKIKAMGPILKKIQTRPFMQDFLNELLLKTLTGLKKKRLLNASLSSAASLETCQHGLKVQSANV